jgi:hypothetical protein
VDSVIPWLLDGPPWVGYRTRVDLLEQPEDAPEVRKARQAMPEHPQIRSLISDLSGWPGNPATGVSNASHPLNRLVFLADTGIRADDPGMREITENVMAHQSPEGAFQLPSGGSGRRDADRWAWKLCDFPSLLYALVKMGLADDPRVRKAIDCLTGFGFENGWPCVMSRDIQWYTKPGAYDDPCPIVNIIALKTLVLLPEWRDSQAACDGAGTLLDLWEQRERRRPNLFGIGSRFQQLKEPFVWYDILHMLEVLTQFPFTLEDRRLREMLEIVRRKADTRNRFTVESVQDGWEEWDFGQKKEPSRWLTLLVHRIFKRAGQPLESGR